MTNGADLFDSPNLYPLFIDGAPDRFVFVPMTREKYRNASFHNKRDLKSTSILFPVALDQLTRRRARTDNPHRKAVHYVFHTAFCGSTLLSRYLDIPGCFFVYREPSTLTQLSLFKHGRLPSWNVLHWPRVLELSIAFLSRTELPEETAIVKLGDGCNNLIDELLGQRAESRGLILYSDLETFLISTLKSPSRRKWVRNRIKWSGANELPEMRPINPAGLSDSAASAYVWLAQILTCRRAIERNPEQMCSLNCRQLFDSPGDTLQSIFSLFGKPYREELIAGVISSESKKHGKTRQEFDVEQRENVRRNVERECSAEIEAGLAWFDSLRFDPQLLHLPSPLTIQPNKTSSLP